MSVSPANLASQQRTDWHQLSIEQTAEILATNPDEGLAPQEAKSRLVRYGPNDLVAGERVSVLKLFLRQFTSPLILILLLAGILSGLLGDKKDMVVIFAIVVVNGMIAFHQEYRAEKGFASLKQLAAPLARVRRGGFWTEVPARELVPGDIVHLENGFLIPADGRVLSSQNLRVQEASLTGESETVDKKSATIIAAEAAIGDRTNMLFMGTSVVYGRGAMIVTSTGSSTELGKISQFLQQLGDESTPLQRKMRQLGRDLGIAAFVLIGIIFLVGLFKGIPLHLMFFTSVSLAIAAVPEGLPAVVTIALAIGAQRMLKRKALIRKLPAVETLGVVTVICSDKTGTLTENKMRVAVLDILTDRVELSGKDKIAEDLVREKPSIALLIAGASLCNDAVIEPQSGDGSNVKSFGDPTEIAFLLTGSRSGLEKELLEKEMPRVGEVPFTSERKRMTTIHKINYANSGLFADLFSIAHYADSPYIAFTKGAVDSLLGVSGKVWIDGSVKELTGDWKRRIESANDELANQGMRVLGLAAKFLQTPEGHDETIENDLIFIGLAGLIDPSRPEAKEAVMLCKDAGIRPIMITGDHPLTAKYVANELGIPSNPTVTGSQLSNFSAAELKDSVKKVSVYARISPEHKWLIVDALQNHGEVVAVTGDGVNDAPALKKADIGVAMGITGTDVSKEAADMVLLDDNFATLVQAVSEGRRIYDNIRKFLRYILSTNSAEILVMVLGSLIGMPLPLLPLQILWVNLVTDGLPALALSFEPAERNAMKRAPYSARESIFSRGLGWSILWSGLLMGVIVTAVGYWQWHQKNPAWQTLIFTTLTIIQMGNVLAIRSECDSLFRIGIRSNKMLLGAVILTVLLQLGVVYLPFLQTAFATQPLTMAELGIAFSCSFTIFTIVEIEKWIRNRLRRRSGA